MAINEDNLDEDAVIRPFRLADGPSEPWPRPVDGELHHVNKFKDAAENEIDRHRKELDALEEDTADAHGDLEAGLTTEAQEASAYAVAIDANDIATHDAKAPWAAPKRLSGVALVVVSVVAVLIWFAINSLAIAGIALGSLITRGPLAALFTALSAPIIAGVIAYSSSRSATLAGRAAKDLEYTPGLDIDPDAKEAARTLKHSTWFGVGVEVFMGMCRIVAVHSIVTAILLFAASMSMWLAVRWASFEHRSRQVERSKSTGAAVKKTGKALADARADLRSDWGRVNALLGQLRGLGEKTTNSVNAMWSRAATAHVHDNPGARTPLMPHLHGYDTFLQLAAGNVPAHLQLKPLVFTDVESLRTHPRRHVDGGTTKLGPLELGPGGGED